MPSDERFSLGVGAPSGYDALSRRKQGARDASKSAAQEDTKVRRRREGHSDTGPDTMRSGHRQPATTGLRPNHPPPCGSVLAREYRRWPWPRRLRGQGRSHKGRSHNPPCRTVR